MTFTEKQISSIRQTLEWYFTDSYNKPLFIIGGYAGTGKSTILSTIIDNIGLNRGSIIFAAFTGKASLVLRMKGLNANTIHKAFYNIYKLKSGKIMFSLKKKLEGIQLIVIDEISMVNQKMIEEILSFGIPVIGLGDPGQLPPVFGANTYIDTPDCFLTEVMRTDDISGILTLSTMARNGEYIPYGNYGLSQVLDINTYELEKHLTSFDVILCWKNSTRIALNKHIRQDILGIKSIYPIVGDKLMCLANNYNFEVHVVPLGIDVFLTNGLLGECKDEIEFINDELCLNFYPDFNKVFDYEHNYFELVCDKKSFDQYSDDYIPPPKIRYNKKTEEVELVEQEVAPEEEPDKDEYAVIDYGYAFTVHKSQGSEWDNVLVIDEYKGPKSIYPKWLYTALTRGKKRVTLLK